MSLIFGRDEMFVNALVIGNDRVGEGGDGGFGGGTYLI